MKSIVTVGFFVIFVFNIFILDQSITQQKSLIVERALPEAPFENLVEITTDEEQASEIIEFAVPLQLLIESVGVQAFVESVGILDGGMAVPVLPENVGWYEFGARPGEVGSAVFAGHVNWKDRPEAVFTNLKNVQIGDMVQVINRDGEVVNFLVDEIKSYPFDADASEVFSSDDGLARLNLITCDGVWNPTLGSHESRLVIFTIKI